MMFEPRPPLPHKPPQVKRKMPPYTGISQYTSLFEKETPKKPEVENPKERKQRLREQLMQANREKNELLVADWDPKRNFKATEYVSLISVHSCTTNDPKRFITV